MRCQLNARTLSEYGILAQAHNRRETLSVESGEHFSGAHQP